MPNEADNKKRTQRNNGKHLSFQTRHLPILYLRKKLWWPSGLSYGWELWVQIPAHIVFENPYMKLDFKFTTSFTRKTTSWENSTVCEIPNPHWARVGTSIRDDDDYLSLSHYAYASAPQVKFLFYEHETLSLMRKYDVSIGHCRRRQLFQNKTLVLNMLITNLGMAGNSYFILCHIWHIHKLWMCC